MKKKPIKVALMLVLVSLAMLFSTACENQTNGIQQEPAKTDQRETASSVTGDGNLSLPKQRALTFGTSGKIAQINAAEGDRVTTGQPLAKLDTASLERGVTTAEDAVSTAELTVEAAELAIKAAEIDVKVAEDTVRAAEIDLKQATDSYRQITYPYTYSTFVFDVPAAVADINNARRQVEEAQELLKAEPDTEQYQEGLRQLREAQENLIDASERLSRGQGDDVFEQQLLPVKDFWTLRTAQLTMEKAESALIQAKNSRDKANITLDKSRNDLNKAIVSLNNAENNLSAAKDELEKAVIVAPFDGIIAMVDAKPGDTLSVANYATKTIFKLVDTSRMELKADVDEIDIAGVKPGQKVMISVDALPETKLEGRVTFISPVASERVGVVMYEVKVTFDIPEDSPIRAGMSATAEIIVE